MNTSEITQAIDETISRLQQAKGLLQGTNGTHHAVSSGIQKKRPVSAAARRNMVAAQKARWAKVKKSTK